VTEANVSTSLAGLRAMRGEFDEARACIALARRVYADLGLRFAIAGLCQIAGSVESLAGDVEAAEHSLREGYEILAGVGARGLLAAELAHALVAQGRLADAAEYVAVAEQTSGGDIAPQIIGRAAKAHIAAFEGRDAEAVDLSSAAVALAEQTDALTMIADANLTLSEVFRAVGREAEASTAAERALEHYAAKGHVVGERAAGVLLSPRLTSRP
jgi:hypothetical protein